MTDHQAVSVINDICQTLDTMKSIYTKAKLKSVNLDEPSRKHLKAYTDQMKTTDSAAIRTAIKLLPIAKTKAGEGN